MLVPEGTYQVVATKPGYLGARAAGVQVKEGAATKLPTVVLPAGDVNGDDRIDLLDRA